ncbi:MAG: CTB family bacteriocin [Aulosira sp. ZfuCHP01]|nr:CTB family bacteriocin [Aulosira sp. ZfuVER01]MDZ8000806.1 CTB family bacteriocin [Aulosira sp. DedVER01a]MDZ8056607.1 CTB family bacteriocin [Aulosira sp. ZfuCHP01]
MSVENQAAIELSEQELDVVAGGADILFDTTKFKSDTAIVAQNTQSGPGGSSTTSAVATQKINTSAVHFIGLGL